MKSFTFSRSMIISPPYLFVTFCFLTVINIPFSNGDTYCDATDRKYNCDCIFEASNRTVYLDDDAHYNASADLFVPAIQTLRYCQGSFQCKPNFKPNRVSETINSDNYLICFNDESCLSNGGYEVASLRGFSESCIKNSCMFLKDLIAFNITNAVLEVDTYMCIKVGPKGLKDPYCLKPACKSFIAIEKLCVCNFEKLHCTCSSYCHTLFTNPSHKTYALFLTFGDIYVTKGSRGSLLHWIILIVLCIGLKILLIIFYKLCKAAVDPTNCENEIQNTEILRRILTTTLDSNTPSVSTTAKNSFSTGDRGSPPPTYEQVLKDKCIEFKKSMA